MLRGFFCFRTLGKINSENYLCSMINLEQLGVHLPQGFLFENVSLQINRGDKIGLVGKNGAGKSTMMRLIAGWDTATDGKIHKPKDTTIGFLTQDIKIDSRNSVFEYLNVSNVLLTKLINSFTFSIWINK